MVTFLKAIVNFILTFQTSCTTFKNSDHDDDKIGLPKDHVSLCRVQSCLIVPYKVRLVSWIQNISLYLKLDL